MRENLEEIKCILQSYNKKNSLKIFVIAVVAVLVVAAIAGAVVYVLNGRFCGCCHDDFADDFDDDFDDNDDDEDFVD